MKYHLKQQKIMKLRVLLGQHAGNLPKGCLSILIMFK